MSNNAITSVKWTSLTLLRRQNLQVPLLIIYKAPFCFMTESQEVCAILKTDMHRIKSCTHDAWKVDCDVKTRIDSSP